MDKFSLVDSSKKLTSPVGGALSKDSAQIFVALVLLALCIAGLVYIVYKDKIVVSDLSSAAFSNATECKTCTVVALPQDSVLAGGYAPSGNNSGTKRALLFGCNYNFLGSACIASGCVLQGCIEDVRNISSLLETSCGFLSSNISLYVDDGSTTFPSKNVIKTSLSNLMTCMVAGDTAVVWYSGHGAQISNSGSEGGYNECWCPPDTLRNGQFLTDDELNAIIRLAPSGSNVFIGSDSCHSGTVFDLEYIMQNPSGGGANRGVELGAVRGRIPLRVFPNLTGNTSVQEKISSSLENPSSPPAASRSSTKYQVISDSLYTPTNACIVSLSASQDYDTAADAYMGGENCGAMTWAFRENFSSSSTLTDLLENMRLLLKGAGFSQIPQITMGTLINPNLTTLGKLLNF